MSRAGTIVAGALVVALAWALLARCGGNKAPPVKHILIADRVGADLCGGSRSGEQRIALDLRAAYTQVLGKPLELDLAARGEANVVTAAALVPADGVAIPEGARITFRVEWDAAVATGKSTTASALEATASVDALEATTKWTAVSIDLRAPLKERSRLRLIAEGPSSGAGAIPPEVRVAWAVPHVRGYTGTPLSSVPDDVEKQHARGPNVLVISIDTLRADHLGCYGYERATSPNLDALAQRSVLFEQATSSAPWTLPSYGSLFTGLAPGRHYAGMSREREQRYGTDSHEDPKHPVQPLRDDVPTLAELFRDAGWSTAAFVNNVFLLPTYGLGRGFERYAQYQYNAAAGVDYARQWIGEQDGRWLCFVHFMDPHVPYCAPEPWDSKFTGSPLADHFATGWPPSMKSVREAGLNEGGRALLMGYYDGEIAYTDDQVGRLLRELEAAGQLANTIVVIHSDHGEEFWDHGGYEHGHSQYQELLHVPVILHFPPRVPENVRVRSRMRSMDLFPTLLELAGLPVPPGIDAESLLPLLDGRDHAPRELTSEFLLWGDHEIKARFSGPLKLITNGASENQLFDLDVDPREQRVEQKDMQPLFEAHIREAEALRNALRDHHARTLREMPPIVVPRLRGGEIELKIGLGYGEGAGEPEPAPSTAPRR